MKHGKRPTKKQKIKIQSAGLNPDNWLVTKTFPDKFEIVHRTSGKTRLIGTN